VKPLWDKGDEVDALVRTFTVGDDPVVDLRFARHDLDGSVAHVRVQEAAGLLSGTEAEALVAGLRGIDASTLKIAVEEEDVHTAIENRLAAAIGPLAGKLHTGRSRNDQVATAVRLWLRDELAGAREQALALASAWLDWAEKHPDPLTGYTHLQRAMPSSYALWAAGYAGALLDTVPLLDAAAAFADRCPLGSAAGYGTPLPLDRELAAKLLGFSRAEEPVTATQLTRGAVEVTALQALATMAALVARWAWDVCLYASAEFALIELPPSFTTGSSIMPQKRNPDVAELLRAHAVVVRAAAREIEDLLHLPGGYHRDLQLTKAPLVRGVDAARRALVVAAHLAAGLVPRPRALDAELFAAAEAFSRPEPFREAYREVAAEIAAGTFRATVTATPAADLRALRGRLLALHQT
jgi:argininosuccinate lyase